LIDVTLINVVEAVAMYATSGVYILAFGAALAVLMFSPQLASHVVDWKLATPEDLHRRAQAIALS
jgi:hypothetical protein